MICNRQVRVAGLAACFAFFALVAGAASGVFSSGYFDYQPGSDPKVGGVFYGYQKASQGTGDDAFVKCTNLVVSSGRPMLLIWGKDGCTGCNNWINAMNYHGRTAFPMLRKMKFINAFFRGSATAPQAVKEAYLFFIDVLGVANPSCHSVGFYGVAPNGRAFTRASTLVTGNGTEDGYDTAKDSFQSLYLGWSHDYETFCSNNIITVNTAFRVRDTKGDRLEVTQDMPHVHVPVEQTGSFGAVVTNLLEAAYPDGSAVTNEVVWSVGGPRQATVEVALTNAVGGSVWTNGEGQIVRNFVRLTLMSAEGRVGAVELPTCDVHLVAKPANALNNPLLWGEKKPADFTWGEWTLDFDAATNRTFAANAYLQPGKDDAVRVQLEPTEVSVSAENGRHVVTVTSAKAFLAELEKIAPDFELTACEKEIEPLVWTSPEFALTNYVTTIYTNEATEVEPSVTRDVTFAGATLTNGVYAVFPKADGSSLTNLVSDADSFTTNFTFTVVDMNVVASPDEDHPNGTVTVATNVYATVGPFEVGYSNVYYLIGSEYFTNATASVDQTIMNKAYIVSDGGATTNAWDTDQFDVVTNVSVAVTNFITLVIGETAGTTVSGNGDQSEQSYVFTPEAVYPGPTSRAYQFGTDDGGASPGGAHAYTLRITGGVIWDARVNAFMEGVLNTNLFTKWCETYRVGTVVCDLADPDTGASLFTCNVASNTTKRSGTAYLSRHGLKEGDFVSPTGDTFEIALLRADGSLAGRLAPQCKTGRSGTPAYGCEENLARLTELLELADDPREAENNTVAGILGSADPTQYEVAYGAEPKPDDLIVNELQISDKQDFFKITGFAPETVTSIAVEARVGFGGEVPAVTLYRGSKTAAEGVEEILPRENTYGTNVWSLTAQDAANGLFARVSAWADPADDENEVCLNSGKNTTLSYTVVALPVDMPGSVGFTNAVEATYDVGGEREIDVTVLRSGVTGPATATVRLDAEATTVPAANFSWVNKNGETNLTWAAEENGPKTIKVKVHDVLWTDNDGSNIVFSIVAASPEAVKLETDRTKCVLNIVQEYDPDALSGQMAIVDPSVSEIIYTNQKELSLTVVRMGARRTPEGRLEARGEAFAQLSATTGTLKEAQLAWPAWGTGGKTTTLTLPSEIGKDGYTKLTVTLVGRDEDNKNITVAGSNTVTICALPVGVPGFGPEFNSWQGVENVAFSNRAELVNFGDWSEVDSAVQLEGELPPGITCTADKTKPALVFAGTPTKPRATVYRSLWCLRLVRPSLAGSYAYTMPVTVEIAIKPLGDVNPWFKPSETSLYTEGNRIWNDLPLTNGEGRLTGLLNVSAASNGRFSARYRKLSNKTVAFAATAITQCDGANAYDGAWRVEKTFDGKAYAVSVNLLHSGGFRAEVTDGELGETSAVELAPKAGFWSRSHAADDWTGDYTVAFVPQKQNGFCLGAATASVRVPAAGAISGAATFAVTLPNGKTVSGSTTFVPAATGAETALLPIFSTSATEDFTAILKVTAADKIVRADGAVAAAEGVTAFWHHEERDFEEASYDTDFDEVCGARFENPASWEDVWWEDYGTNALSFACDDAVGPAVVKAVEETLKAATKGDVRQGDPFQLNGFQLNRTTGVVAGTLCVRMGGDMPMTVSWKGVVLPGLKPFVLGSYWGNVVHESQKDSAKRVVRKGGRVWVVVTEK